jgi:hypothetical protein
MKNKVGRPSKFQSLNLQEIKKYVLAGLTDEQLAVVLRLTKQSLNNYKHKHPEFFDSLKDWRKNADGRVKRSLYERACGYTHPAVKFFQSGDKIIRQEFLEHHPPDPTSMIFWLKNRQPKEWRDQQIISSQTPQINIFIHNILQKAGVEANKKVEVEYDSKREIAPCNSESEKRFN